MSVTLEQAYQRPQKLTRSYTYLIILRWLEEAQNPTSRSARYLIRRSLGDLLCSERLEELREKSKSQINYWYCRRRTSCVE